MSPQQAEMIETLQKRNITKVIIKPTNKFEAQCADATLTKNEKQVVNFPSPHGEYSATIEQLRAYCEQLCA